MSIIRTVLLAIARACKNVNERIQHALIFKNSLTAGSIQFYAFGEVQDGEPVDGQVIVYDTRFKCTRICGYHFDNRYLMRLTPRERCMAVWNDCLSTDGMRPLGILENDQLYTPYGPAQPIPPRYRKLFAEETKRLQEPQDDALFI